MVQIWQELDGQMFRLYEARPLQWALDYVAAENAHAALLNQVGYCRVRSYILAQPEFNVRSLAK